MNWIAFASLYISWLQRSPSAAPFRERHSCRTTVIHTRTEEHPRAEQQSLPTEHGSATAFTMIETILHRMPARLVRKLLNLASSSSFQLVR